MSDEGKVNENGTKAGEELEVKAGNPVANANEQATNQDGGEEEDLFKGPLEEYKEAPLVGDPDKYDSKTKDLTHNEILAANREGKRTQFYKYVIYRPKKDFEAPYVFHDKEPGIEGPNLDIKPTKQTEFPTTERAILDIELQTANESNDKAYQVPKVRLQNNYTNTEEDFNNWAVEKYNEKGQYYIKNEQQLMKLESFLYKVKTRMEEALQSNETIDIFQNDFDLDRTEVGFDQTGENKKEKAAEIRTFRDNTFAGEKTKREKSINYIRFLRKDEDYVAHTYFRNLSFEERIRTIGIPQQAHILFWNFQDREINSPVYVIDVPMELTCFEINPTNPNYIVGGLISGQIIVIEVFDLLGILKRAGETDIHKKVNKKDQYNYFITLLADSHKSHISAMKWFDKGINYNKHQITIHNERKEEVMVLATLGEDGQILIWDFKQELEQYVKKGIKIETSAYIKPVLKLEVNKMDSLSKICGTGLDIQLAKKQLFVSTDEGQIYVVDWTAKITPENLTNNIRMVLNNRYFRPIIAFQASPFWPDKIFLTVHDFHFCLWYISPDGDKSRPPIFMSPNLKNSSYTFGRFSPSRPSVIYVTRNNGNIDIWDFLDESHKPSVKESFVKENITFLDIFQYSPNSEENYQKKTIEYFCIGDSSGQMTIMEVPKLFSEAASEEKAMMWDILQNEINRQEDMELRYRTLDEEQYKNVDEFAEEIVLADPSKEPILQEDKEKEYKDLKDIEDAYLAEIDKITEEIPQDEEDDNVDY